MIGDFEYIDFADDLEHEDKWDPLIIGFEGDVIRPGENINQILGFKCPNCQFVLVNEMQNPLI